MLTRKKNGRAFPAPERISERISLIEKIKRTFRKVLFYIIPAWLLPRFGFGTHYHSVFEVTRESASAGP